MPFVLIASRLEYLPFMWEAFDIFLTKTLLERTWCVRMECPPPPQIITVYFCAIENCRSLIEFLFTVSDVLQLREWYHKRYHLQTERLTDVPLMCVITNWSPRKPVFMLSFM
jgi:hypothetical protein